jgi:hypothetical protein
MHALCEQNAKSFLLKWVVHNSNQYSLGATEEDTDIPLEFFNDEERVASIENFKVHFVLFWNRVFRKFFSCCRSYSQQLKTFMLQA